MCFQFTRLLRRKKTLDRLKKLINDRCLIQFLTSSLQTPRQKVFPCKLFSYKLRLLRLLQIFSNNKVEYESRNLSRKILKQQLQNDRLLTIMKKLLLNYSKNLHVYLKMSIPWRTIIYIQCMYGMDAIFCIPARAGNFLHYVQR